MTKLFFGGFVALLSLAAGAADAREPGAFQLAQVMSTPSGCFWLDAGDRDQDLWCRDEDGQAHRTATRRHEVPGRVCPRGKLDDGVRCVSEGAAMRSAASAERYDPMVNAPPPFNWQASKTSTGRWRDPSRPDAIIVGDGHRWRRNYEIHQPYGD